MGFDTSGKLIYSSSLVLWLHLKWRKMKRMPKAFCCSQGCEQATQGKTPSVPWKKKTGKKVKKNEGKTIKSLSAGSKSLKLNKYLLRWEMLPWVPEQGYFFPRDLLSCKHPKQQRIFWLKTAFLSCVSIFLAWAPCEKQEEIAFWFP